MEKDADGDQRGPPFKPLEEVLTAQDGSNQRLLCGADAPSGRAPRGNLARELRKAISSEKGKWTDEKGASSLSSQMEMAQAPSLKDKLKVGGVWDKVSLNLHEAHAYRK